MTQLTDSLDDWLDGICPFAVFRLTIGCSSDPAKGKLALKQDGFFHVKSPADSIATNAQLQDAGFFMVDTNVTFELPSSSPSRSGIQDDSVVIRTLAAESQAQAEDLARRSFRYSRFHQDPLIPNSLANEINARWVADYFQGSRGEWIDGAFVERRLVGFNAILKQGSDYVIDIIAVDPAFQGRGVGSALIAKCIDEISTTDSSLRVGTQISNTPAIRAYEKLGFRLKEARHVFHAHVRDGRRLDPITDPPWTYSEATAQ